MLRLDYLSCFLTILSTVLIGKKLWQSWVVAGANSIIIASSECERRNLDSFLLILFASDSMQKLYGIGDRKPKLRIPGLAPNARRSRTAVHHKLFHGLL